jgi:hypothetical protein
MEKRITIDMFSPCIPYEQLELVMGKREYKKFMKWMFCQTVPIGGVYVWDLGRYLNGLSVID